MEAVLDHPASDQFIWKDPHAHIDMWRGADERDAMHELFPVRARLVDRARREDGTIALPRLLVPHVSGEDMRRLGAVPIGKRDEPGNLLTTAGINRMGALLIASGGTQAFDATHTAIGVGDTATAATQGDTDLAAAVNAANRWVQVVDSAPTFATRVLTVVATYPTGNANFAWAEWAIAQNTASAAAALTAPMLNRKVASLGTKTSSVAWTFTFTVTFS